MNPMNSFAAMLGLLGGGAASIPNNDHGAGLRHVAWLAARKRRRGRNPNRHNR